MLKKRKILVDIIFVSVISIIIICISMRVWNMDFNVPVATNSDAMQAQMIVKSIWENGWKGLWFNERIGSPEISALIDTPLIDYPMLIEYLLAVNIFPSISMSMYIVYILTFPTAAITMYLLLRYIKADRVFCIVLSILYSVTPFHFLRGMGHVTLSNYYVIPIGIFLALVVLQEDLGGGECSYNNKFSKKIIIAIAIILVGLSNVYYSFFLMLAVLVAVVYKMIIKKSIKPLFYEFRIFLYMAAFFILGILPKIIYAILNGENKVACIRIPQEAEIYSLKLIQMLLPPLYSRVGFFRKIAEKYYYQGYNINENYMATLGLFATIGFVLACIWFVFQYASQSRLQGKNKLLLDYFAVSILILILYATAGGFGTIFSYLITPELRCLNRASIVIATLCFAVLALLGTFLLQKWKKSFVYIILIVGFLGSLYLDVPINNKNWQNDAIVSHQNYQEFFDQVESQMEEGDAIYQLPMVEYPESRPINNMLDYSLFRGYIYTDHLKWSYGGLKGRNVEAMELYVDNGMSESFIEGILEAGFLGVYIDTDAYEDAGVAINDFYHNQLGLKQLVSADGKLFFYNLSELGNRY